MSDPPSVPPALLLESQVHCFGGEVQFYRHASRTCHCDMTFSVFLPPQGNQGRVPVLYYLSGLTCTAENFTTKAGAQRYAARHGLMLVAPDTSPRGAAVPDEPESWDFGQGAGFYVDATEAPWAEHYQMYSYVTAELPQLIAAAFPAADTTKQGIMGHSMGGHGALVCALRNPERYRSVSALAPIAAAMHCPWGEKALGKYLGGDRATWAAYDASELVKTANFGGHILIDQGTEDSFLATQLKPEIFEAACARAGQPLTLRLQPRYDHSYYFIASFMEDHIQYHAMALID
ncbi:MAG: S-formylglutathione hydrolase [Synechococcales cyanobacterium RM1_1_8]|nr:S-formylglutathione hydrolase [Synechococcales cyanobacterium RM1_1_8]